MPAFFSSLRFRLTLVVLLAMLPLLILSLYLGFQEQSLARSEAKDELSSLTDLAAENQDTLVTSAYQLLNILSLSPEIRQSGACPAYLEQVNQRMDSFSNLEVFNPNGDLLCSASSHSAPVNEASQVYFQQALRTGEFSLGRFQPGLTPDLPVLKFGLPVLSASKQVELVLAASLDLGWLGNFTRTISLPAGTALFIIDQDGTLLAQSPLDPALQEGRPLAAPALQQALQIGPERGQVQGAGPNGEQRLFIYQPLVGRGQGRIYITFSTPLESAQAAANQRALFGMAGLLAAALLAALASWFFGEKLLLQPARRLVDTARRLTAGDLSARTGLYASQGGEIGALGKSIDEMAVALEEQTARLKSTNMVLSASEARFRSAFEQSAIGMALTAPDGTLLKVNNAFCQMMGYTRAEMENGTFGKVTHPEDIAISQQMIRDALDGKGEVFQFEKRYIHRDGQIIWAVINTILQRDPDGKPLNFITDIQDITARRKMELALAESEQKFRSIFESMNEMVALHELVCDPAGQPVDYRILDVNPAFTVQTGIEHDRAIGALATELYGTGQAPYLELYAPAAQTGQPLHFETYFPPLDKYFSVSVVSPAPNQFATVTADITARRKAEQELQQLNARLEERVQQRTLELSDKNRALETFAYSVSHDLKAPLRGIDGYSQILLSEYSAALDSEGRSFLTSIRRGAVQMGRLIDDLLAYSRIERQVVTRTHIDFNDALDVVLEIFSRDLAQRHVELIRDVPPGIQVWADQESLVQALHNLMDNALKFTRDVPNPRIEIHAWENQYTGTITVCDNGVGFDMKYHDRIFEVFQRLHRAEEYPGTGVGLAIVRKSMERVGGRAWAESVPAQGSKFYLEIPKGPA